MLTTFQEVKFPHRNITSPSDSATSQIYGVATLVLFASVIYYLHILAKDWNNFKDPRSVPLVLALIAYGVDNGPLRDESCIGTRPRSVSGFNSFLAI